MKKDRSAFLGASEIAACMGLNPWCTPLQLWALKTGKIEPDEESEAAEWGNRLEEVVAKKFSEKHEVKLMAYKKRFVHEKLPFLSCELDRVIVGTDELVEVKTCGVWVAKKWDGEDIPMPFVLQVNLQLGLSKRRKGWFAVLVGGQRYLEKEITFNEELYDREVAAAIKFWEVYVKGNVAPVACGEDSDTLLDLFPSSSEIFVKITDKAATNDVNDALEKRQEVSREIDAAIKEKETIDAKLKQIVGENAGIETERFKVSWKQQSSQRADVELMREKGVFDQYSKLTSTRVLRVSAKKQGETK